MASQQQTIDVHQLSIEHLNQIVQKLNEEYNFILESVQKLKVLQQKFTKSKECLKKFEPQNNNKSLLVPLTSTLYISGKLSNTESVLVDIGTGYFVDMKTAQAEAYFQRRIDYIGKQVDTITPVLEEKGQARQVIGEVLQMKVQAAMAANQKTSGGGDQQSKLAKVNEEPSMDSVD